MAELKATPYANPFTGWSNDVIQGLLGFMQDKRRTQQLQGLGNLLESTGIPKTVERAAYADSPRGLLDALTNVNRANVPFLKPETAEAAMTLAPIAGRANKALIMATKGLPVGASIKNVGEELIYHGTSSKAAKAIEKSGFDVTKSADGTIWFTNNPNIGEVAATGKGAVVKRLLDEKKMKLGSWDETDKFSTDELIQKGFDGLKLEDKKTGEITYQIFNPEKLAVNTTQRKAVEYPLAPAGTRYEEFGGKLTYMTPDEYLQKVRPLELDDVSLENIASLKSHVQSGGKLDPLHIYKDGKEDGRHRAYMAKELGIEKIPVALHTEANNLGQNIPMDALSLLAEQKRKEITGLLE
jgi:hypothetical protein